MLYLSLEELSLLSAELEELDVAFVVVWHPDLCPAILVKVREGQAADGAIGSVEDCVLVIELCRVTARVKSMS